MAQKTYTRWVNPLILGLSVFLVFCLVFEPFIELPGLVLWLGRWHPVMLHFPIVLLLLFAVLALLGRKVSKGMLALASVSALLTAISGFFLGTAEEPKGDTLVWHQWLGAALVLCSVLWYALHGGKGAKAPLLKVLQLAIVALVIATGHNGGMVTHGADFLALPQKSKTEKLPEDPLVYGDVVAKVLDKNCVSCHNPNKKKGQLLMTDIALLRKGGESGPALVPGQPGESELVRRLRLPLEDEEHMPPEGKRPLGEEEVRILERWIALGASDTLRLTHLETGEELSSLIGQRMEQQGPDPWQSLPKVADSTLANLASEYVTVRRVSGNSHALTVSVFMPPEYGPSLVRALERVAPNIVELDLSGLPLGAGELETVALCQNLERLELDRTGIGDPEFAALKGLSKLKTLKAYSTMISDGSIPVLQALGNLKTVYLWDTKISDSGISELQSKRPAIHIDKGLNPELEVSFVVKDSL